LPTHSHLSVLFSISLFFNPPPPTVCPSCFPLSHTYAHFLPTFIHSFSVCPRPKFSLNILSLSFPIIHLFLSFLMFILSFPSLPFTLALKILSFLYWCQARVPTNIPPPPAPPPPSLTQIPLPRVSSKYEYGKLYILVNNV
jgi:hypothetical protein